MLEPTHRPYEIYADAHFVAPPTEMFKLEEQKHNLLAADENYISTTRNALEEAEYWHPLFAEKYNISPNLREDYVLAPVTIFLSGIPNKKGHSFTYEELTSADPYLGQIKYKTWERKPCQLDHQNKNIKVAKGIILSASLQPARSLQGDLYKLILLQAYDRRTWPQYVNKILTGEYNSYSMGASASSFNCSICSKDVPSGKCGHIPKGMLDGTGFTYTKVGNQLAFVEACDIVGFECSLLTKSNPANPVSWVKNKDIMQFV